MRSVFYILIFVSLFTWRCSEPETADLTRVDRLLETDSLQTAQALLTRLKTRFAGDSVQTKRILARVQRLRQKQYFIPLDSLIQNKLWAQADTLCRHMEISLNDSPAAVQRRLLFDFYHRKSRIDSALHHTQRYWNSLKRACDMPTRRMELQRFIMEQVALHLAQNDSVDWAREYFDRSFRQERISQMDSMLRQAYFLYADGKFNKSFKVLQQIPDSLKDKHWQHLEHFLSAFKDRLTLKERFRLW